MNYLITEPYDGSPACPRHCERQDARASRTKIRSTPPSRTF